MSYGLPAIDISAFSAGQSFQIKLDDVRGKGAFDPANITPGYIRMYNESGSGLNIQTDTGDQEYLPAGGWYTHPITQNVHVLTVTVVYKMQNPQVQLLLAIYYQPGEYIPPIPILGNSPTSGVSQTTSIQTLSQEGQPKVVLTIDIGDSLLSQLITVNNDGTATLKVDVAGVAHTVLQILASANFLRLGQTGDTVETVGSLLVDQAATITGNEILNGNLSMLAAAIITASNLVSNASTNLVINEATAANKISLQNAGTEKVHIDSTGMAVVSGTTNLDNGAILTDGSGDITLGTAGKISCASMANPNSGGLTETWAAVTGTGATMVTRLQTQNQIAFQAPGGTTMAQVTGGSTGGVAILQGNSHGFQWFNGNFFPEVSFFTGTGSGTYNHTFNGAGESLSPFWVCPIVSVSGSATQGYDTVTTTQVHVTLGASLGFKACCL